MSNLKENCIFCKIAAGEIGKLIYEDELCAAFDDVNPQAPVHMLIISKKHIARIMDLQSKTDEALIGHMVSIANKLAKERKMADEGYRLVINNNEGAGQSVWHIHIHVLGGRKLGWPPG